MKCNKCGAESGSAKFCPECGADLRETGRQAAPKKKKKKWIPIVIVVLLALAVIGSNSSKDPVQSTSEPSSNGQAVANSTEPSSSVQTTEATPTPEPTPEPTPIPADLEILDYTSTSDQYWRYVTGHIKNNTNRTYSYVQIEINTYKGETRVGSTFDNINNLAPGDVWEFKAMILEDDVDSFKIVDVTGW